MVPRMSSALTLLLSFCALTALASHVADWELVAPADAEDSLTFFVALNQRNFDKLEALLYSVSDPKSPSYGRIATKEEIAALVNPPKEEHDRVVDFLTHNRLNVNVTSYGDAIKVTAFLADISAIFTADFYWYHHTPSGHKAIRADLNKGISIPKELKRDIYMVTGLVSLPIIMRKHKVGPVSDSRIVQDTEFGYFAPSTIRRIYNIPPQYTATNKNSSQCALEFWPEGAFSYRDYQIFTQLAEENFYNFTKIVGQWGTGGWGNDESELDVQLLGTIGAGAENWYWTVTDGWIYEMAVAIFNNETIPWVFSISYGWPEALTCNSAIVQADCTGIDNAQYIARANAELAKLGAMRISVIVCSQDEGAPSVANIGCTNKTHPVFGIYPGSSPYATSVSGSAAVPNNNKTSEFVGANPYPKICNGYPCSNSSLEHACTPNTTGFGWATGGGFSEFTPSPLYQALAVKAYLGSKAMLPPTKYFWPTNRGYPDISAIGARVLVVGDGQVTVEEGTSASTPIIAGIATLLNDYRFNTNKTPLGFLNPLLYTMAQEQPNAFNDIVVGSNECPNRNRCCEYGYGATVGWDAVTGLGSPNFGVMLEYIKKLN